MLDKLPAATYHKYMKVNHIPHVESEKPLEVDINTPIDLKRFDAKGLKVRITHLRISQKDNTLHISSFFKKQGMIGDISPKGGKTVLEIIDGVNVMTFASICSNNDGFNKRAGVNICLARLLAKHHNLV